MAFVLRPGREVGEELRKIARQELRRASTSLRGAKASSKVHDARKRVKKIRAVVKLMSEARDGEWTKSDRSLRTAGRLLSDLRDTDALVETLDGLRKRYPKRLSAVGGGDAEPVAPNDSEANRAKNRRVAILLKATP